MSSKYLEAKKRHHYVWAKYLTGWGGGTSNVFYTTKTGKFAYDSVRAIAVDDYFYKTSVLTNFHVDVIAGYSRKSPGHLHRLHMSLLDDFLRMQRAENLYRKFGVPSQQIEQHLKAAQCNLLEDLHAVHEKEVLQVLPGLVEERLDVLQEEGCMIKFLAFFGHQFARTKAFREGVFNALSRRNALEGEVAEATMHAWWFLSYMFGVNIGASLYEGRHVAKHALLINKTDVPFITSDQPIVNVHPCVSENELVAPLYSDLYYPISPSVAYIICDSERFNSGRNEIDQSTAAELNSKLAAQAMMHIIGDTENAIRPFKQFIGRRYKKLNNGCAMN